MSICRGCPHYAFEVVVQMHGNHPVRVVDSCSLGLADAGFRQSCSVKPIRDNGQRRRRTDITDGQSVQEPDHGINRQAGEIR